MKRLMLPLFGLLLVFVPACQARGGDPSGMGSSQPAPPEADTTPRSSLPPPSWRGSTEPTSVRPSGAGPEALPGEELAESGSVPAPQIQDLRKQLLESLVSAELFSRPASHRDQRGRRRGPAPRIRLLQGKFPSEAEFAEVLPGIGVPHADEMKGQVRRNLATEQLLNPEGGRLEDPRFRPGDRRLLREEQGADAPAGGREGLRIFTAADSRASADAKSKARQKIELILKEIRGGKDFADAGPPVLREPGRQGRRGDGLHPPQRQHCLSSPRRPSSSRWGRSAMWWRRPSAIRLLKVTDKKAAGDVTLAEARPRISALLFQQKEQEAFNAYLTTLKAGAKIGDPHADTLTSRREPAARDAPGREVPDGAGKGEVV